LKSEVLKELAMQKSIENFSFTAMLYLRVCMYGIAFREDVKRALPAHNFQLPMSQPSTSIIIHNVVGNARRLTDRLYGGDASAAFVHAC